MFGSLFKTLFPARNSKIYYVHYSNTHLGIAQYNHVTSLYINNKSFSSSLLPEKKLKSDDEKEHSFTVSYLVNSCGLSLENAISVSKKVHFQSPKKPDSVLTLLKNHGFTDAHISKLVMKRPTLLFANAQNNLLPKLDFLHSIGVPSSQITRIVSYDPTLFYCSLENRIIPSYNSLKSLVGTNEKVVKAFSRSSIIFRENLSRNFAPNIEILRELGVPQSSILLLVTQYPSAAFFAHKRFNEAVEYLKRMGFDPMKSTFIQAIQVFFAIGEAVLKQKFEVYSRWGWSKDETISAFKYQPHCMVLTEKRIMRGMDFFVNKMGWPSKIIARCPLIFCYSLEKRIIPRCLVVRVLLFNSLIKKDFSVATLLTKDEKYFLQKYVIKFQEQVPQLMDVYKGKVDIVDLGIGSTDICEIEDL